MILLIQVLVITIAIVIVVVSLSQRVTHFGRAWKKIFLILMAIVMIVAVLFPDVTNVVASLMGIGRGADLLLYLTVLAFIVYALNNYLNQQDQRDMLFRLARKVALMDVNKSKKK